MSKKEKKKSVRKCIDNKYFYNKGCTLYHSGKYGAARDCLSLALYDEKLREKAIIMLVNIDIREGKYRDARERLKLCSSNKDTLILLSYLEKLEYNFNASMNMLNKIEENKAKESYYKAILYLDMGDLDTAKALFEKTLSNSYYFSSMVYLVIIDILKNDIDEAKRKFDYIDKSKITKEYDEFYNKLSILISYFLGQDITPYNAPKFIYFRDMLLGDSDSVLFEHVKDHTHRKYNEVIFRGNIDICDIINEARYRIKGLNPIYSNIMSIYKFNFDEPVGYFDDKEVTGVSVIVPTGTDKIVTMYPTDFSSKFDSEGFSKILK